MFINVLKSFLSSKTTGAFCSGRLFLADVIEVLVAERTVVNFDLLVAVAEVAEVEPPGVLLQLDLEPHELLNNSLLIFGSQSRGTEGGGDGLGGACLLGDNDVRVNTSVG